MKTLILHDRFQFRGGAERMVLDMAVMLDADIMTEFWTNETFDKNEVPHKLCILAEGEPPAMVIRYFRAQWNFWWKTRKLLKNYDMLIFSGNNCLATALRPLTGKRTLFYCHSPVRYVYDLLKQRRAEEPKLWKRVGYYDIGKWLIRGIYRFGLSRMQTVVANSENVRQRLLTYCNKASTVLYPPIQTDTFKWLGQSDYYLSWARLDPLKRVEQVVRAFQQMPEKNLVVASGGEREAAIRELAKGHSNIQVLGWVEMDRLKELVGRCIATIYVPIAEDFGMSPVEGMSAGKPCIGVNDGGLTETILPEQTGFLIPKECVVEDIANAVRALTPERALQMRPACVALAQKFSAAHFETQLRQLLGV